jgi:hypothetical protein
MVRWAFKKLSDAHLTQAQRRRIIPMLANRTKAMHTFLAEQAAQGAQPWARLWREGHGDAWRSDTEYIAEREDLWHRVLLG